MRKLYKLSKLPAGSRSCRRFANLAVDIDVDVRITVCTSFFFSLSLLISCIANRHARLLILECSKPFSLSILKNYCVCVKFSCFLCNLL